MTSGDGGGEDVESNGDDAMLCGQGCITDGLVSVCLCCSCVA